MVATRFTHDTRPPGVYIFPRGGDGKMERGSALCLFAAADATAMEGQ